MFYKIFFLYWFYNVNTVVLVEGDYQNNPFLNNQPLKYHLDLTKGKQSINQWNVAVVVPPPNQLPQQPAIKPPSNPENGYVWLQVPASYFNNNNNNKPTIHPPTTTTKPSSYNPGVQQPTTEPIFTIEPPDVLTGASLNKKCLKPRGQFPSTTCNRFVNCWDGQAVEQNCPKELLFNPVKGYCDFAANVDCNGKPVIDSPQLPGGDAILSSPTTQAPGQSSLTPTITLPTIPPTLSTVTNVPISDPTLKKLCLKPRGQFPSKSCSKYVNCWDDVAVEQECPEGLSFSSKGFCDYTQNVDCTGRTFSRSNINTDCPLSYGTFREKLNCNNYYTCIENKIVAKYSCPEGFSFSDKIGVCDYSYRVDCSKEPIVQQRNPPTNNGQNFRQCNVEQGTFRDKHNCNQYYTCVGYQIVANHTCPEGLNFNDTLGICDYADRVNCNTKPAFHQFSNTFVPQIPEDFMDKIDGCKPGTVFRLNAECSIACRCKEGLAEIIQCPNGLAYDSAIDKCLPPHLARC